MHDDRSRERALLLAWRDGDRKAGSELIRTHAVLMQRFFANKVHSPQIVEELSQRTFAACVAGVERFRGDSNFRTWLFGVANNILREWFRERRRDQHLDFGTFSVEDSGVGHSSLLAATQQQQRLLAALRRLPLDSQVVLELYYWEELTASELGEIFEIPAGTARSRLRKAKLELRAVLDTMDRTHERPPTTEAQLDDWAQQVQASLKKS